MSDEEKVDHETVLASLFYITQMVRSQENRNDMLVMAHGCCGVALDVLVDTARGYPPHAKLHRLCMDAANTLTQLMQGMIGPVIDPTTVPKVQPATPEDVKTLVKLQ